MARYVHHVPGRLRIKSDCLKRNEARAGEVRKLLRDHEGVVSVLTNTVTGSLLIGYDPGQVQPDQLIQALKRAGCCADSTRLPDTAAPWAHRLSSSLAGAGQTAGKAVVGVLVEKMVERSAIALIGAVL
ncbi:MAG: heavy-metal-associated domain-containing protein [Gammaproteobacteria bacterium]|jgi:hypothetical protein